MSKITDIGAAYDKQFERVSDTPRTDEQYNREKQYRSITKVKMSSHGFDAMTILCKELERQVAEAVASERERCALVCEEQTKGKSMWIEGARACATAIRGGE